MHWPESGLNSASWWNCVSCQYFIAMRWCINNFIKNRSKLQQAGIYIVMKYLLLSSGSLIYMSFDFGTGNHHITIFHDYMWLMYNGKFTVHKCHSRHENFIPMLFMPDQRCTNNTDKVGILASLVFEIAAVFEITELGLTFTSAFSCKLNPTEDQICTPWHTAVIEGHCTKICIKVVRAK